MDGRLSGAAASPTASPACLTKPAEGMLPFWAERFSLRAQFRGKSLVFRDSSEHPLSSAHSGSSGELAGSHREAALIAAPISKPQAAIPSPAARNHEGMLSSQGQHGPYPGPSPSPGPQWDPTAWSYCRRSTLVPAGGAVPLLGCLAPSHDLSVPQNCWSVTVINPCACCKDKGKCSSVWGAITEEMPSTEGRDCGFTHHTRVCSRSCPRVYINPDAS